MTAWKSDQLAKLGKAEEVEIQSRAKDGSLGPAVTVWVVRLGDDLFLRSVGGRTGRWFRGTQEKHEGKIAGAGVHQDVDFVDAEPAIADEVDAAYRAKYRRYAGKILNSVLTPEARSSTLKLAPRTPAS